MVVLILSIAPHHMPNIWMVCNDRTPKILINEIEAYSDRTQGYFFLSRPVVCLTFYCSHMKKKSMAPPSYTTMN